MKSRKAKLFTYRLPKNLKPNYEPHPTKPKRARVYVRLDMKRNSVWVFGNSAGLVYLAKCFAGMALHKGCEGLHVHLCSPTDTLDKGSVELTIGNWEFGLVSYRQFKRGTTTFPHRAPVWHKL